MGAMDVLVNEVDSKFGLGAGKAGSLLTAILSLIQEQSGGLCWFSGSLPQRRPRRYGFEMAERRSRSACEF